MHYDATDSFTTSASIFGQSGDKDVIRVECESLAGIMESFSLDFIDILKLDCEGAEYDILYNTPDVILNKIGSIAMETHQGNSKGESRADLESFLAEKGFNTHRDSGALLWAWK